MTLEGVFPDLLAPLPSVAAVEAELARSLRRLVAHARAVAGALGFTPPGDAPAAGTGRAHVRTPATSRARMPPSARTENALPAETVRLTDRAFARSASNSS